MNFLRITTSAGLQTLIPMDQVVQVSIAADATGATTAYAAGRITRGRITDLKYLDGAAAAAPTITVVAAIPAKTDANTLYELVSLTPDGATVVLASNRNVNF